MKNMTGPYAKKIAVSAALFGSLGLAYAISPHFVQESASGPDGSGDLTVNFKEAGLGANQNIDYTASATATATYVCQTTAKTCPQAANKVDTSAPVSASGIFNSGKNGSVTGSLKLSPPEAGDSLKCGNGQTPTLASVTYTDVKITDTTYSISESIPGTYTQNYFTCKGK